VQEWGRCLEVIERKKSNVYSKCVGPFLGVNSIKGFCALMHFVKSIDRFNLLISGSSMDIAFLTLCISP